MEDFSVDFFKQQLKNKNTDRATSNWINRFRKWAAEMRMEPELELYLPGHLNEVLEIYFSRVKQLNGKEYEPGSLCVMQAAMDRHLKEKKYGYSENQPEGYSILNDEIFKGSRETLEGRARYLRRELGMGKRPNKASSINVEEENRLWQSGQLGPNNARSLINSIWFLFTQHFGLRGRQEHYDMKIEDFCLKVDDDGNKFFTYAEGITKTRQAGLHDKHRVVIPKMFETKILPRCPVYLFELYISKRPETLRDNGPLYLAVIDKPQSNIWYKKTRLGINTLDNIMKSMNKNSPLSSVDKKITNHSARKTVAKKLKKNRVQKSDIVGITGHSTEAGLDPYDSGDEEQQREYSHAIDNIPISSATNVTTVSSSSQIQVSHHNMNNRQTPSLPALDPNRGNFQLLPDNFYQNLLQAPLDDQTAIAAMMKGQQEQHRPAPSSSNVPVLNFYGCTVNFTNPMPFNNTTAQTPAPAPPSKRRRIFIESDDESSQEK